MSQGALLVYAVSSNSLPETVFLTTRNFTNGPKIGLPLEKKAKRYGDSGFVIFRESGEGAIHSKKKDQALNTDLIGPYVPLLR